MFKCFSQCDLGDFCHFTVGKKKKDLNEDVFMVLGLNCGMMFMGIKMCNQIYF